VVVDGSVEVDLVGGDYCPESLQLVFSIGKCVTAVAVAIAEAEGLLEIDAPIGDCWEAFKRPSTAGITTRDVLSHRSGIAAFDRELSFNDLLSGRDVSAVEQQEPYWPPGTGHGYHGFTFGTIINGVFERTVGCQVGEFVQSRIAEPLGIDVWIGAPPAIQPRLRPVIGRPSVTTAQATANRSETAIPPPPSVALNRTMDFYNHPAVAQSCWPSVSCVADARSLATAMAATMTTIADRRLLSEEALDKMIATRSLGPDLALGVITHFGSGVQRPSPLLPMVGPGSFGHEAAGGSLAVADPELGLAVAFTTDVFPPSAGASLGAQALIATIGHCLRDGC
jgi:CubicO group peptidase (beta-lactamase class C family)